MRVTIAQLNPVVGDVEGNLDRLRLTTARGRPRRDGPGGLSRLYLVGYPPRDLLERSDFVGRAQPAFRAVVDCRKSSRRRASSSALRGDRERPAKGYTMRPCWPPAGRILLLSPNPCCPLTTSSTRRATLSPPGDPRRAFQGRDAGHHICEDAWTDPALWPAPALRLRPGGRAGRPGRHAAHQHLRLALSAWARRACATD